jgi:hypothetical protein
VSFHDIGDGTKDIHYREYRLRKIQSLLEQAWEGATFILDLRVMDSDLKTPPLNLCREDMELLLGGLAQEDPEQHDDGSLDPDHLVRCGGCSGTCCTGVGSDPCTC